MAAALVGCSSAVHGAATFSANQARVPISFSSGLADARGLVDATRMHPVGKFHYETDGCVRGDIDLSQAVNAQVTQAGGDAIVRLEVSSRSGGDCVEVKLDGDIVRVDR